MVVFANITIFNYKAKKRVPYFEQNACCCANIGTTLRKELFSLFAIYWQSWLQRKTAERQGYSILLSPIHLPENT